MIISKYMYIFELTSCAFMFGSNNKFMMSIKTKRDRDESFLIAMLQRMRRSAASTIIPYQFIIHTLTNQHLLVQSSIDNQFTMTECIVLLTYDISITVGYNVNRYIELETPSLLSLD